MRSHDLSCLLLAAATPLAAAQCLTGDVPTLAAPFFHADAIAVDGDTILCTDGAFDACFLERTPAGWVETARYPLGVPTSSNQFPALDLRGDFAVATDPNEDSTHGEAFVFQRVAGHWRIHSILSPSGPLDWGSFGTSVAIADDGDIFVGAYSLFAQEAMYVFERGPGGWLETQKLLPSIGAGTQTGFGISVATDGDTMVAGAHVGANVFVFEQGAGGWAEVQVLPDPGAGNNYFGTRLALCGQDLLVGAPLGGPGDDGVAYFYERVGSSWSLAKSFYGPPSIYSAFFAARVALDGDRACATTPELLDDRGMAQLFGKFGSEWQRLERIDPPTADSHQRFGQSVAIDADALYLGAPYLPTAGGYGKLYEYGIRVRETPLACTAQANSTGAAAELSQVGCPSRQAQDLELIVARLPPSTRTSIVLATPGAQQPFLDGTLCLTPPFARFSPTLSDAAGVVWQEVDFAGYPGNHLIAGTTFAIQAAYRDALGGPVGANLSDAIAITFRP